MWAGRHEPVPGDQPVVEQTRSVNQSIAELEKTIAEAGSKLEGRKSLTSIKGLGKITGAILLSVIGDLNDFLDEGRLVSYFGIVPLLLVRPVSEVPIDRTRLSAKTPKAASLRAHDRPESRSSRDRIRYL